MWETSFTVVLDNHGLDLSLREYVLIAQDRRSVEVYARGEGETTWTRREYVARERIVLASLGLEIEVDTLYADAGL